MGTKHSATVTMVGLLAAAVGCSNEGGSASLGRTAAPLRPGQVQVVLKDGEAGGSQANQVALKSEGGIVRTARPSWKFEYNLAHEVLDKQELKQDVARWGVRIVVKDAGGRVVDRHEKTGLKGEATLKLGDKEGFYTVQVGAYDLAAQAGTKEPLGVPRAFRILRDATPPQVALALKAVEDLAAKTLKVSVDLTAKDADVKAPVCGPVTLLSALDEALGDVSSAPSGKEWEGPSSPGSWSLARAKDLDLGAGLVAARVTCTDATGNPAETVVALAGVQKESLQPRLAIKAKARGLEAIPRLSADRKKRLFLFEARAVVLDFLLSPLLAGKTIDPDLAARKRNDYAVNVEARAAGAADGEPWLVVWSGTPKETMDITLPASLVGAVDLSVTLLDASAGQGDKRSVISRTVHPIVLPPAVTPSLDVLPVASLVPARLGGEVAIPIAAVSDGLPFESGDFPDLEMSEDGQAWTRVQGVSYVVDSRGAASTGDERWRAVFPYPFVAEKALRFRASGTLASGVAVVSNASARVLGAADVAPRVIPASERQACTGKSKFTARLASAFACLVGTSSARIQVLVENRGASGFAFSSDGAGGKRPIGWAVYAGETRLQFGTLAATEEGLNQVGLDAQSAVSVEVPLSVLSQGNLRLLFDQEASGSHSLAQGSYCYVAGDHPSVTLRENNSGVTAAPFRCEDY